MPTNNLARSVLVATFLMMVTAFVDPVQASPGIVPEIREPVETKFATYYPNLVKVVPNARQFEVQPGLANVENAGRFSLSAAQNQLLQEHGFFMTRGRRVNLYASSETPLPTVTAYRNFADVYYETQYFGVPAFVTSDVMLHAFHRLFSHVMMTTEENFLVTELSALDAKLLARLTAIYDQTSDPDVAEAARLAATYVAVGLRLLDMWAAVPDWAEGDLAAELDLINSAAQTVTCPLFKVYLEDYSQYRPRGHYTRSSDLERYFRAMMWHGRMTFALRDDNEQPRPDLTRAALLLSRELLITYDTASGPAQLEEDWLNIFAPTEFFAGASDDLMHSQYAELAESVYGAPLAELTPEQICDGHLIQTFMSRAELELPEPRIRDGAVPGMRLFGQRFAVDSWYLSELTWPAVGTRINPRLMPSVLDVMPVLGDSEAELLQRLAGQEEYANYSEQVAKLRADVIEGPAERWVSNLYWGWLYTLTALLEEWGEGFPGFMQSPLWSRRQLIVAAGSWTELRHDTILYVKQAVGGLTGIVPSVPVVQGYVEPNPWAFGRLAALARFARSGLTEFALLDPETEASLGNLEQGSELLMDVAIRELEQQPISPEQYRFIYHFGDWLTELLAVDGQQGLPDDKERTPVVADVYTEPNDGLVLEEGTEYPGRIVVAADVEGRLQLCVGAVFIHHEFTWPQSDRLTDERWWQMLEGGLQQVPWWAEPVLDTLTTTQAELSEGVSCNPEYNTSEAEVTLLDNNVAPGQDLVLTCTPQATAVELRPAGQEPIRLTVNQDEGEAIHIATTGLPEGELILIAELVNETSYALRVNLSNQTSARLPSGRLP